MGSALVIASFNAFSRVRLNPCLPREALRLRSRERRLPYVIRHVRRPLLALPYTVSCFYVQLRDHTGNRTTYVDVFRVGFDQPHSRDDLLEA